jgi:putative tryptophan/tyrosine transport system substrate-binding protein
MVVGTRRQLIRLLGGAVAAWPVAASAQQAKVPTRIGFLPLGSPSNAYDRSLVEAFRQGLRMTGLTESRDIVLDIVWVGRDPEHAVAELLQRGAQMLIPCGSSASVAAQRLAPTIPIVFINVGNPIAMGLVESLSRPGRNATGFSDIQTDLAGKLVDIARELPNAEPTVGYIWHTGWPDGENRYRATERAAESAGMKLRSRGVLNAAEINDAIAAIKNSGTTTLIIQPSPFTFGNRDRIIGSAATHGLATIFGIAASAREGGLIAYGPDQPHMYRSAPFYVDRILKGAKPADLPVEQPTKIGLVVNLKTAKVLRLDVPLALLIRADELIE